MQVQSLKLTIQDVATKDEKPIAAIFGTLYLLTGEHERDEHNQLKLDETGAPIPVYETINFTTALQNVPGFQTIVKHLVTEALTLKDLQVAKKNGTLSHYVNSITNVASKSRPPKPTRKHPKPTKLTK